MGSKSGPKWSKVVQSGPKWSKVVLILYRAEAAEAAEAAEVSMLEEFNIQHGLYAVTEQLRPEGRRLHGTHLFR